MAKGAGRQMAVDPAEWVTVFEVLEQTGMPLPDILRLADEGVLTTRHSGSVMLFRRDDVSRLVATGHALVTSAAEIEARRRPPRRRRVGKG